MLGGDFLAPESDFSRTIMTIAADGIGGSDRKLERSRVQ